jgi:NADPH:quinone reductase-like Zn-dependent oxidoreductase
MLDSASARHSVGSMMKQWQLGRQPGWQHLELTEQPAPKPNAGEVLVQMKAASLNYRDTLVATMTERFQPGRVPLSDGAGEVIAVGEGVMRWKIGDHVAGTFFRDWISGRFDMKYHQCALGGSLDGVLREQMVFPEHGLVRVPQGYTFEQAATLPCAGLTAWYALVVRGEFQPGDTVLVLGTGGVSVWGLQIATAAGGRVIVTSSSDEKLAQAKALGAWETINYQTTPDWEKEVLHLTNKRGVDHVLEVGGPGTLGKSLASVAAGGHVAQIGVLTGFDPAPTSLFPLVSKNARMNGIYVGHREAFEQFVTFLETTKIKPVIDRVFAFDKAREAYAHMASGAHFGKVIVSI